MEANPRKRSLQTSNERSGKKVLTSCAGFQPSLSDLNVDVRRFNDLCSTITEYQQNIMNDKTILSQMEANNRPKQELEQCKRKIESNEQGQQGFRNRLNYLTQKILNTFNQVISTCHNNVIWISGKLLNWKMQQKVTQYGGPDVTENLKPIAEDCKALLNYLVACLSHLQRLTPTLIKLTGDKDMIDNLHASLNISAQKVLDMSFVVVIQPPMLVKGRLTVRVSLLPLDLSNLGNVSLKTQCHIISEDLALAIRQGHQSAFENIETIGTICAADRGPQMKEIKEKDLEHLVDGSVGVEFRNVRIKVNSRKTNARDSEAVKAKYYMLFTSNYTVFGRNFKIRALSFPFMVSVHGTQDPNLLSKIFYDTAFSPSPDNIPMTGPAAVPWLEFAPVLAKFFSHYTQCTRRLKDSDLEHLLNRMFNGEPKQTQNLMISWDTFATDKLVLVPNKSGIALDCTFWLWFYRILDMLKENSGHDTKVKALWDSNLLEGFITKEMAEQKLLSCSEPTFLLRFSDNHPGCVSAVVYYGSRQPVTHLKPFKSKLEVEKFSLPVIVCQCEELENVGKIYPNNPKSILESYSPMEKTSNDSDLYEGFYSGFTIKFVRTVGEGGHGKIQTKTERPYSASSANSSSSTDFSYRAAESFSPETTDSNQYKFIRNCATKLF